MPQFNSLPWSGGEVPIVYEDHDIIVLNKPVGLLTVPIPKSAAENLFTLLREYVTGRGKIALTVHRIDRYTSGLVLFAKHKSSRHQMVQQFLSHTPERIYHALVHGVVKKPEGQLVHRLKQIEVSFKNIQAAKDDPEGAEARLWYHVVEQWEKAALVEMKLDTGFKNQIRAQFAIIGNPLVGDIQYGRKSDTAMLGRQALHAHKLTVTHPGTRRPISFEAPYPDDFAEAMQLLKLNIVHDAGNVLETRNDKPARQAARNRRSLDGPALPKARWTEERKAEVKAFKSRTKPENSLEKPANRKYPAKKSDSKPSSTVEKTNPETPLNVEKSPKRIFRKTETSGLNQQKPENRPVRRTVARRKPDSGTKKGDV